VTSAVVVLSTAGSEEEAARIATALLTERLAACVNLVAPLTSISRWRGAVERASEVLLVIKTRKRFVSALIARLCALHSYDVPEAIVLPITAGARPYLAWLMSETTDPTTRTRARPRRQGTKKKK
jgi:periplasmic divalent cation tolerance protein